MKNLLQNIKIICVQISTWNIWTWGVWERLGQIFSVIIFVIFGLLWFVREISRTACWLLVNTLDLCLIIPMFIVWIIIGKNYIFKLEGWINDKTGFFNKMYYRP